MPRRDFSKVPFAATGDTNAIPDATQPDGSVSLAQGWGFDYQRDNGAGGGTPDPLAKNIDREDMNGILNEITASIGELQQNGYPIWVATAAPYPLNAIVRYAVNGLNYRSTVTNNSSTPGTNSNWIEDTMAQATETFPGIAEIATFAETNAGLDDSKIVTSLKLVGYINSVIVQATESALGVLRIASQALTNAGTDDTTAVTPKKLTSYINSVLVQATESILGVLRISTQAQANAGTDDATAITPKKMRAGFSILLSQNGYITFPTWMGGLIIQWARATISVSGGYAWTYPTNFPNEVYNCWGTVYAPFAADVVTRSVQPVVPGLTACAFAVSANSGAISAPTGLALLAFGR